MKYQSKCVYFHRRKWFSKCRLRKVGHCVSALTHWGRVTHICVSKLTIIGSDNGLSPGRRQGIIWTNAGILLIRTLGTNFSEILGVIHSFSKMHLKLSSAKCVFGLGLNELMCYIKYNRQPMFKKDRSATRLSLDKHRDLFVTAMTLLLQANYTIISKVT